MRDYRASARSESVRQYPTAGLRPRAYSQTATAAATEYALELAAPDMDVALPPWLRAVMHREVTDEPEYANAHLAR